MQYTGRLGEIIKGSISIHAFPLHEQGDAYRSTSKDFSINVFIRPPEGLQPYFEQACRDRIGAKTTDDYTFMPCVIGKRTHQQLYHHSAALLTPPGITENSKLFASGLAVPQLKIKGYAGHYARNSDKGYLLYSDHVGTFQNFYAPPSGFMKMKETDPHAEFQGIIRDVPRDGRRHPSLWIITDFCTREEIFAQNAEALKELNSSPKHFWWDMRLD
jgi:hypothetical protein